MAQVGEVSVKLSAQTAAFQKSMATAMGTLSKFASAAAAFGAAAGAFNLARQAAGAETAGQVFRAMGGDINVARNAVGGMVSDAELLKKANLAETMGISSEAFQKLAQISTAAAAKTGQEVGFMFDSIITGTARQSKMILDNLGIMVNIEAANASYAQSLGKTAASLSDVEKKQAFMNEVFKQGEGVVAQLEAAGISLANPFDRFTVQISNLSDAFGSVLIPAFEQLLPLFDPMVTAVQSIRDAFARLTPAAKEIVGRVTALAIGIPGIVGGIGILVAALSSLGSAMFAGLVAAGPFLLVMAKFAIIAGGLIAVAGALRAAWAENIGGIREKFDWLADGVANVGMFIRDMFFDLADGIERAFDGILHFVAEVFATIPRIIVKYLELVAKSLEKTFDTLSAAASALGFEDMAKGLRASKAEATRLRANFEGMQEDIGSAVDTVREFANPVKLLRTGFKGTFEFITGEGGEDFARTAGTFLTETGDLIGRGWEQILKDLGIEFLPQQEVKVLGKTMGEEAGKAISEEVLKAQDAFRERLAELRGREQIETSPFRDITQAFVDAEKERADIIKLAADAGMSNVEALQLSENHLLRQAAAAVNAARTTTEQAEAADFARAELERAGIGLEAFNAQLTGIDWADIQAERPPDIGQMLSDAAGQAISGAGIVTPEVAKGAGEDIGGMLAGVIEGQAPAIGNALGVGLTAAGAGAAGPIAGAIITGLQTVFSIVQGAIDSLVSGIAQLIPEQRLSRAFSSTADTAIMFGLALAYLGAVVASLAAVLLPIGPPLLVLGAAVALVVAAIGPLIFASTLLSMAIMGFVTGPLLMLTAAVVVMTGLFGMFAALIPETEAFQRAMSVVSYAVDRFVGVLSKGMLKPLMAFAGLFAAFMKALEPVLNMFVSGINKLAPHLFNMMRDLAVAFLHLVEFSMHVGNALIGLAQVMGDWFVLPLIKATNAIAGAFLDGAAMMFDVISWMASLPVVGNEEMATAAAAGAATARSMKKSGDGLVSEVEAIIGGLDAFKATPSDFAELAKARDELAGLTYQKAIEESMRLEKETEDFGEKVGEFGESLTNVPQGFKVVAARFQAIVAGESPTALPADTVTPETVTPQQTFIVEQVSLAAENVEDFVRQLLEQSERKGIRYGGAMQARLGLDGGMGR